MAGSKYERCMKKRPVYGPEAAKERGSSGSHRLRSGETLCEVLHPIQQERFRKTTCRIMKSCLAGRKCGVKRGLISSHETDGEAVQLYNYKLRTKTCNNTDGRLNIAKRRFSIPFQG